MSGEVFSGGATTSQHVDAEDDDHFNNTTFKLKRTRSLGLLDEFIPEKLKEQDSNNEPNSNKTKSSSTIDQQFKKGSLQNNSKDNNNNDIISYNSDYSSNSDNNNYPQHNSNQSTSVSSSPSPVASPTATPTLNLQSPELIPHDDSDLTAEPSRHVDYLSYQWDVSDISKSWRYVISKKRDVANAARLENASWRTWAQRRSNLKTISSEVVNWSKESDVTWLYGPILKNNTRSNSQDGANTGNDENDDDDGNSIDDESTATSAVAGDISIARKPRRSTKEKPKPILKKRTVEESIISHSNLFKLELATSLYQKKKEQQRLQNEQNQQQQQQPDEYFNFDALSNKLNAQYANKSSTDNSNVAKLQTLLNSNSSSLSTIKQDDANNQRSNKLDLKKSDNHTTENPTPPNRHIRFNEEVQQCIAYDSDSDEYEDYSDNEDAEDVYDDYNDQVNNNLLRSHLYEGDNEENYSDEDNEDDEEEDDEGGFFLKVKSMSNVPLKMGNHQSQQQLIKDSASSDNESLSSARSYSSIKLLPPTSLNYGSDEESSDEDNPYTSSLSHNVNNDISRGYDYYYDYNTVYTCDPNHSTYQTPDVVDLPENLNLGSNFDYDSLENSIEHDENRQESPITSPIMQPTNSTTVSQSPFNFSDSESDDSDDENNGLSIRTRRSSQALAESIFQSNNNQNNQQSTQQPQTQTQPENQHISSINPNHRSGSISKQTRSSNSLAEQFGNPTRELTSEDKSLSRSFLGGDSNSNNSKPNKSSSSSSFNFSNPISKSSVSPPQTTSENAFFSSPSHTQQQQSQSPQQPPKKTFLFDEDSESDDD
ncbi:REG1 [Candida pseudojiufengensis]|uniref:REG1 n=1 Tax=Candida pseudojiufengensis TaxID=497109 RepID=UPI0022258B95|nr:REG1 [Candida pseudojiufengensis]KAI5960649.1 REG1 [Candida pseudojiufengensis]